MPLKMPGNDDKPFKCSVDGCGQTFTNEDHLTVHKLKHSMSLTLSPGGNKFHFPDQTPTPTKFLKYGEEIGLFTEINKNPFDDAFKSAAEINLKTGKVGTPSSETMQLPHTAEENDTLNTPTPHIPILQHDTPPKKRYRAEAGISQLALHSTNMGSLSPLIPSDSHHLDNSPLDLKKEVSDTSTTTLPHSLPAASSQEPEDGITMDIQSVIKAPEVGILPTREQPTYGSMPVEAGPSGSQTLSTSGALPKRPQTLVLKQNTQMSQPVTVAKESVVQTVSSTAGNITIVQSPPQTLETASLSNTSGPLMLQMLVPLGGKLVPVNIPAMPANSTTVEDRKPLLPDTNQLVLAQQPAASQVQPIAIAPATMVTSSSVGGTGLPSNVNVSMTTKQRLKAAIQQNSPQSSKSFPLVSPGASSSRASSTSDHSNPTTPLGGSRSVRGTVEYQDADSSMISLKDAYDEESQGDMEEDDLKRKKFLERNRAAAQRCRDKKRQWVKNLEKKAEDLQAVNNKLQSEVSRLREEMAQLKKLLLAHKDCPIMMQQQNSGELSLQQGSESSEVKVVLPTVQQRPQTQVSPAREKPRMKILTVKAPTAVTQFVTTATTKNTSQFSRVPGSSTQITGTTAYRITSSQPSRTTQLTQSAVKTGQTVTQLGQIVGQPSGQLYAVDLSKSYNIVQTNSIGKS